MIVFELDRYHIW